MDHWYTLRTKADFELVVRDLLEQRGVEVFLPLLRLVRGTQEAAREEPFFPGLLFARADLAVTPASALLPAAPLTPAAPLISAAALLGVPGVTGSFPADGLAPVHDQVVDWLKVRVAQAGAEARGGLPARPGARLPNAAGPLAGAAAIFDPRTPAAERTRALLQLLARLAGDDVPLGLLASI